MAGILNLAGALLGTYVAETSGNGIVDQGMPYSDLGGAGRRALHGRAQATVRRGICNNPVVVFNRRLSSSEDPYKIAFKQTKQKALHSLIWVP